MHMQFSRLALLPLVLAGLVACNGGSGGGSDGAANSGGPAKPSWQSWVAESTLNNGAADVTVKWGSNGQSANYWELLQNGSSVYSAELSNGNSAEKTVHFSAAGQFEFVARVCLREANTSVCTNSDAAILKILDSSSGGNNTAQLTAPTITGVSTEYVLNNGSVVIPISWQHSGAVTADRWQLLVNNQSVFEENLSNGAQQGSTSFRANAAGGIDFVVRLCQASNCVDSPLVHTTVVAQSSTGNNNVSSTFGAHFAAPFVDATAWPPFDISSAKTTHGLNKFILGFIVAKNAQTCTASWGTYYDTNGKADNGTELTLLTPANFTALRTQGVSIMASFGGASSTPLAVACKSVDALKTELKRVIDVYQLTDIDFDVEGAAVSDSVSIARRWQAVAALQSEFKSANRELNVWLTLPVLPTGLDQNGQNVLNSALSNKVSLAGVNIMAMDYGDGAAPHPANMMAELAIDAANALHAQMKTAYSAQQQTLTDAQLWSKIGITPMIGINDVTSEIFELDDATQLLSFAQSKSIGMLSMWSANRDQQCADGRNTTVSGSCSSVLQTPMQFAKTFHAFNSNNSSGGGSTGGGTTTPVAPAKPTITALAAQYTLQNGSAALPIKWTMASGQNGDSWQLLSNGAKVYEATITKGTAAQTATYSYTVTAAANYSLVVRLCNGTLCSDSAAVNTSVIEASTGGGNTGGGTATGTPEAPTMAWMNTTYNLSNGTVAVKFTWDMWWGVNGTRWDLMIDDVVKSSGNLTANSPQAQHAEVTYNFTAAGTYNARVRLCNGTDCATSSVTAITIGSSGGSTGGGSTGGGSTGGGSTGGGTVDTTGWPKPLKQYNVGFNQSSGKVIATYFAEWGIYGRDFEVEDIPAQNLTHILYAFLGVCGPNESMRAEFAGAYNAIKSNCANKKDYEVTIIDNFAALEKSYTGDKWDDPIRGNFGQLRRLKAALPNLHIAPSIGGWSMSEPFYTMASNAANRATFVASLETFLRTYDFFDGIDIDWEYPGGGGATPNAGSSADAQGYADLMRDIRAMLNKLSTEKNRRYELTSAVGASAAKVDAVDYLEAVQYMDYVYAMSYDFYGAWNGVLGHHAGLYAANGEKIVGFNTDAAVAAFLKAGVPANKLVIGAAMYGRAWKNVSGGSSSNPWTGVGGGALTGTTTQGIWEAGTVDYKGVDSYFQGGTVESGANGFVYGYDDIAKAPYLWNFTSKELITFDDPRSVKDKASYIKSKGLAGFLSWEIDGDNGRLLNAMNEGLGNTKK